MTLPVAGKRLVLQERSRYGPMTIERPATLAFG